MTVGTSTKAERFQKVAHRRFLKPKERRDFTLSLPLTQQRNDGLLALQASADFLGSVFMVQVGSMTVLVQRQVLGAVVVSDAVGVMDDFSGSQPTTDQLLHHEPMFKQGALYPVLPDEAPDVSLGAKVVTGEHAIGRAGSDCVSSIQHRQSAPVGAEPSRASRADHDPFHFAAPLAGSVHPVVAFDALALAAACLVAGSDRRGCQVRSTADRARPFDLGDVAAAEAGGSSVANLHVPILPHKTTKFDDPLAYLERVGEREVA